MITRIALLLAGIFAVGLVGAFFLYVSVFTLVTAIAVMLGLVATLALGFWAGCHSLEPGGAGVKKRDLSAINAPTDVTMFPGFPVENVRSRTVSETGYQATSPR